MVKDKTKIKKPKSKKKPLTETQLNIKSKEQDVKKLKKQKADLEIIIEKMLKEYSGKNISQEAASYNLEKLPLDTLKDFQDFRSEKKMNFNLLTMKLRSEIRRKKDIKLQELQALILKIYEAEQDVLIAKIQDLDKYLGENG